MITSRVRRLDAVSFAVLLLTSLLTLAVYFRLPASMPVHFDLHGRPDGYMPRAIGAWLLPIVILGLDLLVLYGDRMLPGGEQRRLRASPRDAVVLVMNVFLCAMQILVLHASLTGAPSIGRALSLVLGATWVVFGLLMPRVRRNPWIGVRTPWTLSSDENWARTHRVAGMTMTAGGLVALVGALLDAPAIAISAILVSALAPAVYSFAIAKRTQT
jgi:uncharacterized membrane protein